jgi:hypothetical protein
MAKYTFKQFQAEYPDDAACLAKLMEIQYGGLATKATCASLFLSTIAFSHFG